MKSGHVSASAIWQTVETDDGLREKVVVVDPVVFHAQLRRMGFGEGEALVIRVEREEDAAKHGHYKHLFGHLLKPTSEFTGYTQTELKADMKARFLPDGMTSLTQMNAEQFREFNQTVEQCIREEYPSECWDACLNAMALYEQRRVA